MFSGAVGGRCVDGRDQVVDRVLEGGQAQLLRLVDTPFDAGLEVARFLGLQVRIRAVAEAIGRRRRAECRAAGNRQQQVVSRRVAVFGVPGGVIAEGRMPVVAAGQQQTARSDLQLVLQVIGLRVGADRVLRAEGQRIGMFLRQDGAEGEHLAELRVADRDIVLQIDGVARGVVVVLAPGSRRTGRSGSGAGHRHCGSGSRVRATASVRFPPACTANTLSANCSSAAENPITGYGKSLP